MKKLFLTVLLIILVGGLIFGGCASQPSTPTPSPAPTPTPAPAPKPPIKIGLLYTFTGPLALIGKTQSDTIRWAFEQVGNEVGGRKIEFVVEDDAAKTEVALDKVKKLVLNDKIDLLLGPMQTGEKVPVAEFMDKSKVPQIIDTASTIALAQFNWTFGSGGSEAVGTSSMGRYAYEKMGVKTLNLITGDWVSGRTFLGSFVKGFTKQGGKIVSEQYPPITATDFASYFPNFKDADGVVAWFPGTSAATFLAQYYEFGIRKKMPLIAAFYGNFFERDVLKSLAPQVAEAYIGDMTGTLYSSLIESAGNKPFLEAFRAKFGKEPGVSEAQAYTGARVAYEALKAAGGDTTPEKLRQALMAVDIQAPEGRIRFDQEKRIAIRNVYIVKIGKVNNEFAFIPVFTYENVPLEGF